ncbi:Guanine nucleotide exchange factor synembryn family protein [Aspergillus niger]|uniref:Guanine nucleotide exchange factor synembryn family protein n=1 Tax=Aspergillus niger TaxID=5061 RepID=A0A505HSF8_ASPNG|nr:Guanine nucleotide exchange factor synembryn family protein [Aspergillus niger]
MQLWHSVLQLSLLASAAIPTAAASAWGFTDATVSVNTKGAGVGAGVKEVIPDNKALTKPVALGVADTLKVTLTAQEGRAGKHAHQVYLLLQDPETGLDISYPFNVKDNGKSRLDLTQKDLPIQFLSASEPLEARFLIGSFGESTAYNAAAFQLDVTRNADEPVPTVEVSRYGKLPEIHHIFKSDPQSPPIVITLAFVAMVLATLPVLGGVWLFLGVNVNHLPTALKSAPIPHVVFLGSLLSIEGIFFLYYTSWTLFQILPAVAVVGSVAFVSGSRALAIDLDGRDPDFAAQLRTIGPVTPNPTFSPSSTFARQQPAPTVFPPASNPALLVFSARQRLTKAAEQELEAMGRSGFQGREYLDALTIRQVLAMRDRQGLSAEEIERLLRLKSGVVGRLGERGVVGDIG